MNREAARKKPSKKAKPERTLKPAKSARPKATPPSKDLLEAHPEFSCQAELALSIDFEGSVAKAELLRKLKRELMAAIQTAVTITARGLGVRATGVLVQPIAFDCAANDPSDISDEMGDMG